MWGRRRNLALGDDRPTYEEAMASSRLWQQSLSQLRGQSTHVARRKYTPYEKPWTHDKFDEHQDGQARRRARPSRPASSHGIKVVLRQVHYEVAPDRIRSLLVGIALLVKGPSIQVRRCGPVLLPTSTMQQVGPQAKLQRGSGTRLMHKKCSNNCMA